MNSTMNYKIKSALTSDEYAEFQRAIKHMATDAIRWRSLLQERLNMDVAESFESLTGVKFPYESRDIIEWTEDAEEALGATHAD